MAFTSHIFVFYFLPTLLLLYWVLPRRWPMLRNGLLGLAGVVFYGWLNPWFLVPLFSATLIAYALSRLMAHVTNQRRRTLVLVAAVTINLILLGFFKYVGFLQANVNPVLQGLGLQPWPMLEVVLPIGISFYVFKILSYCIDVYRGAPPARSLFDFACYVSFFPQLLSGPIQRYATLDPKSDAGPTFAEQLSVRRHSLDQFAWGTGLFILGFAKKMLLANVIGQVANAVFAAEAPGTFDAWFGAVAYTFQLYFDFSAYSEMAIGLGLMFGFECPRNFNAPCRAVSITDFWRRWHISLSSWFRDYLYIPLGGNRTAPARSYLNLVAVFLLCGLWHGASWTFVIWGIYHGLLLVAERLLGRKPFYAALPGVVQIVLTFAFITVGWVFFRAATLSEAWRLLGIMFVPTGPQGGSMLLSAELYTRGHLVVMALCAALAFWRVQAFDWARQVTWPRAVVLIVLLVLSVMTMFTESVQTFLYFQF